MSKSVNEYHIEMDGGEPLLDRLDRIADALEEHTEVMREHTALWGQSLALSRASVDLNTAIFERQKTATAFVEELNRLSDSESQLSPETVTAAEQV